MTSIGFATLEIIPSLQGVSEAIEKQVAGKVVNVTIEPKVDQRATETAGKQAKETVEKHTKQVTVEPKVDQKAAEEAGKKTGESVAKGASASSTAIGGFIVGALQGAGEEGGRRLGERLANSIPTGMTGAAERIGTALRNSLPTLGASAGTALGTAIGVSLTNAIGKQRLDAAGRAIMTGLTKAVTAANNATNIGVAIGTKVAAGLTTASGVVGGAAAGIINTIGGITSGIDATRQLLGGDDSWAAPGLDTLNSALGQVTPLLGAVSGAATLASAGATAISTAAGIATKAQVLWNAALIANPIGLIVAAITLLVTGLVLFFTKTELGRKIWEGFTEYLKIAWEAIKIAFGVAWDAIGAIWDGMVAGAKVVWDGVKGAFTGIVDFVKGLPGAITNAAKGMWEGLKSGLAAVLNWIGDKWNSFAEAISFKIPGTDIDVNIPKMPRFADGGYTGNTSAGRVAGVVHGGEYVIKASSTAGIQNAMPGLLDYLNNKGALPGFAGGGLVTGSAELSKIISDRFGVSEVGGWRPADSFGEHSTGRALDVMTSNKSTGDAIKDFAIANAAAIDLKWAIWQQRLWYPDGSSKAMPDRGSPTENHMDHVHIFSGPSITNGLLGNLKGAAAGSGTTANGSDMVSGGAGISAASTAGTSDTSSGFGGISLASSFSGLAGSAGDSLGQISPVTSPDGKTQSLDKIGSAVGQVAAGQVASGLSVLGIGDSPGWLKGLSSFASGIKIGASKGSVGGDAAPISAAPAVSAVSSALGGVVGGGQPTQQQVTNFNIQTTDVEPAYLVSQRIEKERSAANLARF